MKIEEAKRGSLSQKLKEIIIRYKIIYHLVGNTMRHVDKKVIFIEHSQAFSISFICTVLINRIYSGKTT